MIDYNLEKEKADLVKKAADALKQAVSKLFRQLQTVIILEASHSLQNIQESNLSNSRC